MPKSTLRILVKNLFKESFYGKEKKNILTVFLFSIKVVSKLF